MEYKYKGTVIRVLIVEDDEDDYFIAAQYIKEIEDREFQVDWCYRYTDALSHIQNREYDIYLVDYRLGAKNGLDLLRDAIASGCEEPVVLLTGKGNTAVDKEAMRIGATDYLIKSELNREKLERCIRYSLERSASLKALRANERKYRVIFERCKEAIFIATEDLQFRDVNYAALQIFGFSRDELMKMRLPDLISDKEGRGKLCARLNDQSEINDFEAELFTKHFDKRYCVISLTKERDPDQHIYVQGIIHDITNLKKAEKATVQAEKLAATSRLIRTLAHEIRNPLNNINLSVDHLGMMQEGEDNKIYINIIERNAKRIASLIKELLNASHPSEVKLDEVCLRDIMDESIEAASDRIRLKKIEVKKNYPPEPYFIKADKEKLKTAFLNILINAIEAMEETERSLSVSITEREGSYYVHIRDTGCGITEENLSRLFEPHFTSKANGLGLGLASAFTIFKSHAAKVEVSSTWGSGTTFGISFPAGA